VFELQVNQADRIRKDIEAFTTRVQQHKSSFALHVLYKYATGYTAAYPMLDAAAADLAKLSKECKHYTELASVFELTSVVAPVTEAIKELYEQLVAVKDVWDCCMMCDVQFQVGKPTNISLQLLTPDQRQCSFTRITTKLQRLSPCCALNCLHRAGLVGCAQRVFLFMHTPLQTWKQTLWSNINTEEMEEGAKNFVKEVKALPKRVGA